MNEEDNVVSQQNSSAPTDVEMTEEKKIKTTVKIFLALMWVAYIPVAFVIFAFSAMAGDDPHIPTWQVLTVMSLINGVPLLLMIASTFSIIKRNTVVKKISDPSRYFLWLLVLYFVVSFLWKAAKAFF